MKFRDRPEAAQKRLDALIEEMNGESDRAVAIVGAAWVEEALSDAIQSVLQSHSESWKRLFNGNGPLAIFSARIDLARLLGIVTDAIRSDLHIIRDIRNEFAHQIAHKTEHVKLSFETDHIRNKCLALKCVAPEDKVGARHAFTRACAILNSDFDMLTIMGQGEEDYQGPRVFAQGVDPS